MQKLVWLFPRQCVCLCAGVWWFSYVALHRICEALYATPQLAFKFLRFKFFRDQTQLPMFIENVCSQNLIAWNRIHHPCHEQRLWRVANKNPKRSEIDENMNSNRTIFDEYLTWNLNLLVNVLLIYLLLPFSLIFLYCCNFHLIFVKNFDRSNEFQLPKLYIFRLIQYRKCWCVCVNSWRQYSISQCELGIFCAKKWAQYH